MAFGSLNRRNNTTDNHDDLAEINIIPLVDVMLVLLIIFMVAAPLSISGIKVELPTSQTKGVKIDEQRIILTIDQNGQYYIDKVAIKHAGLAIKLRTLFQYREKKELYIRADTRVAYGKVVNAMSAAKNIGVERMAMLTVPPTQRKR